MAAGMVPPVGTVVLPGEQGLRLLDEAFQEEVRKEERRQATLHQD